MERGDLGGRCPKVFNRCVGLRGGGGYVSRSRSRSLEVIKYEMNRENLVGAKFVIVVAEEEIVWTGAMGVPNYCRNCE